jgi:hypothetical protein
VQQVDAKQQNQKCEIQKQRNRISHENLSKYKQNPFPAFPELFEQADSTYKWSRV